MLWMPCALQKARTSCVLIQSGFRGALARGGLAAQVEWPSCVLACFPAGVALFDSLHALSPPPLRLVPLLCHVLLCARVYVLRVCTASRCHDVSKRVQNEEGPRRVPATKAGYVLAYGDGCTVIVLAYGDGCTVIVLAYGDGCTVIVFA